MWDRRVSPQARVSGLRLFLGPSALLHQDKERIEEMSAEFKRVDTKSRNHRPSVHVGKTSFSFLDNCYSSRQE